MKILMLMVAAIMLCGCGATTTDPSKGGLFSYDKKAYESRKQERTQKLVRLEHSTQFEQEKAVALEEQKQLKSSQVQAYDTQLQKLRQDLNSSRKTLDMAKAENAPQEKKLAELRKRQQRITNSTQSLGTVNTEAKNAELQKLLKEQSQLEEEVILLQTYE